MDDLSSASASPLLLPNRVGGACIRFLCSAGSKCRAPVWRHARACSVVELGLYVLVLQARATGHSGWRRKNMLCRMRCLVGYFSKHKFTVLLFTGLRFRRGRHCQEAARGKPPTTHTLNTTLLIERILLGCHHG